MRNFFRHKDIHFWLATIGILALSAWYIYSFFWGERVWANNGAGWDGSVYARFAKNFHTVLINKKLNAYYLQHALPSAIVYYVSRALGFTLNSTPQIIHAFLLLQYSLLIIAGIYLYKISRHFSFTRKTNYIFFTAIFISVPVIKKFLYLPIGTDISVLFIGIMILWHYLKKQYIYLFMFALAGAFVYPSMIYVGCVFLCIPYITVTPTHRFSSIFSKIKISIALVYIVAAYIIIQSGFQSLNDSQQINHSLMYISLLLMSLYIFAVLRPISGTYSLSFPPIRTILYHAILGTMLLVSITFLVRFFANSEAPQMSISLFFQSIIYGSSVNPLVSIVCHISYYGPFLFFVLLFWRHIYAQFEKLGLPFVLFIWLYLLLTLGRESRQFINAIPFFVLGTCMFCNKYTFSWRFIYMFIIMSLIMSKIWFPINEGDMTHAHNLLQYPAQRFFMMNGAWMSTKTYYIHLVAECILFGIFYLFIRKEEIYTIQYTGVKTKKIWQNK